MNSFRSLLWQSTKLAFAFLLSIFSNVIYSQEKLEVEGAIIVADSEDPDPAPGTIRYNSTRCDFEGWNGVFWASLTALEFGSVADEDGNTYKTVSIGTQEWMAENLRTTKYRNGDAIPNVVNDTNWENLSTGAFCWYDNNGIYEHTYGKLYNWYAVDDSRGLCPDDWHEPTDADWSVLTDFLDASSPAGGQMKESGTTLWSSPNLGATNTSGFTGRPGGARAENGSFVQIGESGLWWSSTGTGSDAWFRLLFHENENAIRLEEDKHSGLSVRCVKN